MYYLSIVKEAEHYLSYLQQEMSDLQRIAFIKPTETNHLLLSVVNIAPSK